MEGLADKMKPDCNKRVEFNCELNFQWYFCLEFGLLIRRYVRMSLQRNNKFGKLVGLELFGVAGGRSMACRRWTGQKSYQISLSNKK